jgi:hypothetical protein
VPDHPDSEELAAFQAGDGDRRQRTAVEAHLDGCSACAEVVASVDRARRRLALLEEPELPAGLHDRLAAAVGGQAARTLVVRPTPWYRRPVAWGAAAALLLAALVVPFLDRTGELTTASGDAGGGRAAQESSEAPAAAAAAGGVPTIRIPGEVSAAAVESRIAADGQAKQALARAAAPAGGAPQGEGTFGADSSGGAPAAPAPARDQAGTTRPGATPAQPDTALLGSCLPAATALADPAIRPLVPAFFVEGDYQGRPATVLVTTSTGQPGRVDLWVFPRGDCSTSPLTTERVR